MEHLVSAQHMSREYLEAILDRADYMRETGATAAGRRRLLDSHPDKGIAAIFYAPSSRTSASIVAAGQRLGMWYYFTPEAELFSSAAKGETLEDTVRTLGQYFHILAIRHPADDAGERAAAVSPVPVIDAGSGKKHHPTQASLDAYILKRHKGRLDDMDIVLGGDLLYGRTARSLAFLLPQNRFVLVSPPGREMADDAKQYIVDHGGSYEEMYDMREALPKGKDMVYWTRPQLERIPKPEGIAAAVGRLARRALRQAPPAEPTLILDREMLGLIPETGIIHHPMPITNEFTPDVYEDPRAVFFEAAQGGMFTRMAHIDDFMSRVP